MLRRVAHSLGFVEHTTTTTTTTKNKDSKSKKGYNKEFSSRSKDFVVRITHAGGQQELYRHAVPVSKLMTKYPGMCVAKPEVFKVPHQNVLWRDDILLPGHKYILISFKDVEKLKRKYPEINRVVAKENLDTKSKSPSGHKCKEINGKMKEPNGVVVLETLNGKMNESNGVVLETRSESKGDESSDGEVLEECFIPAKDYYIPKEKSTRSSRRRGLRAKKLFVPPLPKARHYRSFGWQPSLPSVKELSP